MPCGKKINNDKRRKEVIVGKVAVHICLTLIIKELKISVEHDKVVTTLNIIFSVVSGGNGARLCRLRNPCATLPSWFNL
jgi:hypothetical protein